MDPSYPVFDRCFRVGVPETLLVRPVTRIAYVAESPIQGRGLFAARDVEAYEVITRIDLDKFSSRERHPWNGQNRDILSFFINHSCDANAVLRYVEQDRSMMVVAVRGIRADEEVTLDYHLFEIGGRLITCLCGTVACRGTFPINSNRGRLS